MRQDAAAHLNEGATGTLHAISSAEAASTIQFASGRLVLERQNSKTFALTTHDLQALLTD